jgi:hypothetical protein
MRAALWAAVILLAWAAVTYLGVAYIGSVTP